MPYPGIMTVITHKVKKKCKLKCFLILKRQTTNHKLQKTKYMHYSNNINS